MKIERSPVPLASAVSRYPGIDYSDCFRTRLDGPRPPSSDELMTAFWTTTPGLLRLLFGIRDLLVRPFGLKTGKGGDKEKLREALERCNDYRFMSFVARTPRETVVSLDDKHLKAYFSIYIDDGSV